jgi:hypothetical protein
VIVGEKLREEETDAKWRQRCQAFLLLLVTLWAQVRNECFLVKVVSNYPL